jgi:hypothetical protein
MWSVDLWADLKYFACGTVTRQCGLLALWVDWKGTDNFVIISPLVVGCGLVGGSQIVGQKDTFYIGCGTVAKQCGLVGG